MRGFTTPGSGSVESRPLVSHPSEPMTMLSSAAFSTGSRGLLGLSAAVDVFREWQ